MNLAGDFLSYSCFQWIFIAHIIFFTAWMAALWYLPRLFVYHVKAKKGSDLSETLKVMERKLLRIIMNPAMILTIITGLLLSFREVGTWQQGWFHSKLFLVVALLAYHGFLSATRRDFAQDQNHRSVKFYRIINEVPTVLFILIVILVIIKPF